MVSFSAASFALANTLAGYLASRSVTPPNPNAGANHDWGHDSIRLLTQPGFITVCRLLAFGVPLHHAIICLTLGDRGAAAANRLDPRLITWSRLSSLCLASVIGLGAPLRLAAYGSLGSRFTFGLAPPNELNTSGIYHYIQHPSYTGMLLVGIPYVILYGRWDGPLAYRIPQGILNVLKGWGAMGFAAFFALFAVALSLRVSEEEAMLKEVFGMKWVEWNKVTKRFIPGIF
ncbi:hypothetical protein QQS21_009252 [Conoideocrella luteorostrata]|uniref:Protein-S-isoprenylcysteine O-methyltransferase n=1 Tax=Conoideocrella luteorostrata TaxID=1105319 RepID=A0AAJ0CJZ7_9HYPO|nr:hypothetical protein QQS21_009252 [Conoideocrella luteorostrata]